MALEDFDIDKIDSAVNSAFGGKSTAAKPTAAKPSAAGPNLEGLNPDLAQRLQQARDAHKQRFGKDLQITSGVRSREEQQSLYNRWKAGEKGIYQPINPADYPKQKTFHSDAVDISTSVPESFLNEFGIHRPMGSKDPVHAVLMTKAPAAKTNVVEKPTPPDGIGTTVGPEIVFTERNDTGIENIDKLMNPEAINAAVDTAVKEPPKKGKVATKASSFFGDVKAGAAGLADTVIGGIQSLPGMVVAETGYAGLRAGEALGLVEPGRAERGRTETYKQLVEPYQRPVGEALGVTESPAYKGEASQRFMQFVGENIEKGADWISQKLGIPKADAENMINTVLAGLPGAKQTKVGQAVTREVGYATEAAKQAGGKVVGALGEVTPAPVQRAVAGTVEAIAPGTIKPKPAPVVTPQPGAANVVPFQPGRASVGAAGVPDATIIQQALQTATPEFQALYGKMDLNKVNTPVVLRHLEGDALPIPVRLTEGEATGNPVLLSEEANLRGKYPELAMRKNEANQALVENIPAIKELAAPDVYATRTIESSQALIDAYKKLDENRNEIIDAKYKELRDAAGGDLPVDAKTLIKNVDDRLKKELLTTDGQSISQYKELKALSEAFGSMTFDNYLAMRRNASRLSKESKDGNIRQAARVLVEELDKLPLTNETAALKPIADQARTLAKQRFDELKKDPAYRAAVEDTVPADKYFDKFVINGVNKNINTMIDTLGRDSVAHQHIKAGTINHLSDKAGIVDGRGNFSQANYNKTLKKLDDVNNFGVIFDPDSQLRLKTLGNVAAYTQFQPRGHYINNSNTLVGYLANKAAGGAEAVGNVAGFKFMGGIPVGTMVRQRVQESKAKTRAQRALEPGAGSTLKDISEGKK
jgi:hypothetical protein